MNDSTLIVLEAIETCASEIVDRWGESPSNEIAAKQLAELDGLAEDIRAKRVVITRELFV